jgi:hypothetical protein
LGFVLMPTRPVIVTLMPVSSLTSRTVAAVFGPPNDGAARAAA